MINIEITESAMALSPMARVVLVLFATLALVAFAHASDDADAECVVRQLLACFLRAWKN